MTLELLNNLINSGALSITSGVLVALAIPFMVYGFRFSGGGFKKAIIFLEISRSFLILSGLFLILHTGVILTGADQSQVFTAFLYLLLFVAIFTITIFISQRITYTRVSKRITEEKGENSALNPGKKGGVNSQYPDEIEKNGPSRKKVRIVKKKKKRKSPEN